MRKRIWGIAVVVACALVGTVALIATAASDRPPTPTSAAVPDRPPKLTDLDAESIADPLPGAPAREVAQTHLGRWAITSGALALTFDPESGTHWILMPAGSTAQVPTWAPAVTRITVARHDIETYNAAEDAVRAMATAEPGRTYSFALEIDAESGRLAVDTNAPEELTAPLVDRFGDAIVFRPSAGISFQGGPPSP